MTYPLLGGDVVPAVAWTGYTPVLTASTTNPTLGSGSSQIGEYIRDPLTGLVYVHYRILFGTSGVSAGSGTYQISLPVAPDRLVDTSIFGNADVVGTGHIRDFDTSANNRTVTLSLANTATGSVLLMHVDATGGAVSNSSPFTWAASDATSGFAIYRGA